MRIRWRAQSAILLIPVLLITGCQVTWREPVIEPLNTNRFYDAQLGDTCDAVEVVVQDLALQIEDTRMRLAQVSEDAARFAERRSGIELARRRSRAARAASAPPSRWCSLASRPSRVTTGRSPRPSARPTACSPISYHARGNPAWRA